MHVTGNICKEADALVVSNAHSSMEAKSQPFKCKKGL